MSDRRWAFVFTTFPVATETFLQREILALHEQGVPLDLYSLWGGEASFAGLPVRRWKTADGMALLAEFAYWLWHRPKVLTEIVQTVVQHEPINPTNAAEQWLGLAAGLRWARPWAKAAVRHAVWASAPATALWVAQQLTGAGYSFGAHAYDLFEDGGDALLGPKLATATVVRTSTHAGQARLVALGAEPDRVGLIRRGLWTLPPVRVPRPVRRPLRVLGVGRLVEKMGLSLTLESLQAARACGLDLTVRLIGGGPLAEALHAEAMRRGLQDIVRWEGPQPYAVVEEALGWADVLLFTGVVAGSGDRAGLPNIIGEALAAGLPVVATPVGAVPEAIQPEMTGLLADDAEGLAAALLRVATDDALVARLHAGGLAWTRAHFDVRRNAAALQAWIYCQSSVG